MGAGGGKAGGEGIGHRHGSPYANATVRKPANAWRVPGISTGERGSQAPVLCVLPQLLCPIFCRVGGASRGCPGTPSWRLAWAEWGPPARQRAVELRGSASENGRLGRNENGTKSRLPTAPEAAGRAAGSVRWLLSPQFAPSKPNHGVAHVCGCRRRGGAVRRPAAARQGAGAARGGARACRQTGEGAGAPHCTPAPPRGHRRRSLPAALAF